MPLFSVIIPTYNCRELVCQAVESVLGQEETDFELLVVDDGSCDGTAEALAAYGSRLQLLRQANAGPGAARNLAIEQAAGRYVAFLDADDLWFPWTLGTYRTALVRHAEPAFLAGEEATDPAATRADRPALASRLYEDYYATAAGGHPVWIGTCAAAVRTDVLRAVGGFPPARINAEDSDTWMRLGTAPGFARVSSPPVFEYRRRAGSATGARLDTYRGLNFLLDQERRGAYPGGVARRAQRRTILATHVRPASLNLLRHGCRREAWNLYRRTAWWNLQQGRLRYAAAFPLLATWCAVAGK